jgi:hypothetical protein
MSYSVFLKNALEDVADALSFSRNSAQKHSKLMEQMSLLPKIGLKTMDFYAVF